MGVGLPGLQHVIDTTEALLGSNAARLHRTPRWTCAEPRCDAGIPARRGGKTFFLHCPAHRIRHSPLPQDFPPPPTAWGRYSCARCGVVHEKYRTRAASDDGPRFCTAECRNIMGPKGGRSDIMPRKCLNFACPNGWFKPRTKASKQKYCDNLCRDEANAARPYSTPRSDKITEKALAEARERQCNFPGCSSPPLPRNPVNGCLRKRCVKHQSAKPKGTGPKKDPAKKITLKCAAPMCRKDFERYKSVIKNNTTGIFFCSAACRGLVGPKPSRLPEKECEYVHCKRRFTGHAGAPNKFCSTDCKKLAQRKSTKRICASCGKSFTRPSCDPDKFCSRGCYDDDHQTPIGAFENNSDGYRLIYRPDHSEARADGWALEHRVVMADHLGHPLADGSTVHHKNRIRSDNRLENLEYWLGNHGRGARRDDIISFLLDEVGALDPARAEYLTSIYAPPA